MLTASVLVFSVTAMDFMLTLDRMLESEELITKDNCWPALDAVIDADNKLRLTAVLAVFVDAELDMVNPDKFVLINTGVYPAP